MLRKYRLYFSAVIATVAVFSIFITSSVKACDETPPSLLSLYMSSNLIVVATYESDGQVEKTNEDQYGYSLDTDRNLVINKVLKGQPDIKSLTFTQNRYHSTSSDEMEEIGEMDLDHNYELYFAASKIKIGQQYLFFFVRDEETGKYMISDESSGVKEIVGKAGVYERSLGELKSIVDSKENRGINLAEWIVKNIEEPVLRADAVNDLAESFYSIDYQDETAKVSDEDPLGNTEDFGIFTYGIAKNLTESQKARIASALYPTLQEAWFAVKPQYVEYSVSTILSRINKSRLAVYAFNMMKSVDKQDSARKMIVLEFLNDVLADQAFTDIYYKYVTLESESGEAEFANDAEGRIKLKTLNESRSKVISELEKRFRVLHRRNFVPVENTEA